MLRMVDSLGGRGVKWCYLVGDHFPILRAGVIRDSAKFVAIDAQGSQVIIREFNIPGTGIASEKKVGALLLGIELPFSNRGAAGHSGQNKCWLRANLPEMARNKVHFLHEASLAPRMMPSR
jgi:hypothetical protein